MFPQLTDIDSTIVKQIKSTNTIATSQLNCFVRIISGAGRGLIMSSNPDWKLFGAAGMSEASFYGDQNGSGAMGVDWAGKPVYALSASSIDVPFKPSPIVTAINVKEGKDQISRHCDLKLTAFTLAQVEKLQSYFMEPGYSLLIEYGWNTADGVSGLIPLNASTIVSDAGTYNLDQDTLHLKRIKCKGEYDSFFGFIVGGNVGSNGDSFDISIKLRGAPGLPTYLQSHNSIEKICEGKVSNKFASSPFGVIDLNLEADDQRAERRFKKMYNSLPASRQTVFVKNLLFRTDTNIWTNLDYINFDPVVDNQISEWRDARKADGTEIEKEEFTQPATQYSGKLANDIQNNEQIAWERLNKIATDYVANPIQNTLNILLNAGYSQNEIDEALKTRVIKVYNKNSEGEDIIAQGRRDALKPFPPQPNEPTPPTTPPIGSSGGFTVGKIIISDTDILIEGDLPIPKDKLFSKNKYIRFSKAIAILNTNSAIESIKYGGRNINVIADITDAYIGAFKGIYSIKPETLIIPGMIPDFSKFFMQENLVSLDENTPLVDNSINGIEFAQRTPLTGKNKEKAYYWGKLENLYINFEVLKKEMESPNKTMRDVLQSLLNEMSAAVESFWNFQIVEKQAKIQGKDTTVYTVVDENWVGESITKPVIFVHSGDESKFLQADLNIDIPGAMTNQIISKRLSLSVNPSQPNIEVSSPKNPSIFNGGLDRFMVGYVKQSGGSAVDACGTSGASGTSGTSGTTDEVNTELEKRLNAVNEDTLTDEQKAQKEDIIKRDRKNNKDLKEGKGRATDVEKAKIDELSDKISNLRLNKVGQIISSIAPFAVSAEIPIDTINKEIDRLTAEKTIIETAIGKRREELDNEAKQIEKDTQTYEDSAKQQIASNVSSNLEKIDVVPNTEYGMLSEDILPNFMNSIDTFKDKFRIYCCRDAKFLNILKENAMSKAIGGGGRLSHPLPIKYSFTIMGKSGIRRGDTFNILGIPQKYANCGLFQVTEVEQTIQDMKWTTRVQGEYRQQQ